MKTERTWVFTPLDLLAPWAVCLGSAALCIYAALAGKVMGGSPVVAKIITFAVAAVFLAGIPLWYFVRSRVRKYDLKTRHGLYVVLGQKNKPTLASVESWTDDLFDFWRSKNVGVSATTLAGLTVFCLDAEKLSIWGRFVRGYSTWSDITIGWRDAEYVRSLFRHELSHHILYRAGQGWDETKHHQIFAETGLRA